MFDKSKLNAVLGHEVDKYLSEVGVQTPMTNLVATPKDEKLTVIEEHVRGILTTLGLDLTDDSLIDTPKRVAKMYVNELFSGLDHDNFPKCTAVENKMLHHGDEMVVVKNVELHSQCEHHLITMDGFASVAYIPHKKVLGLSKINRIVRHFARRPQIQERLNQQIAHAISYITESDDVIVRCDATHFCVKSRGVMDSSSDTTTLAALGRFKTDQNLRREALAAFD